MPLFKYSVLLLLLFFSWASFAQKTTVYASSFGYDPQDSTAVLQQAIDSMADCVIIDDPGGIWYTGPLKLRSNLELIISDGVTVQALRGAFKGTGETMFSGRNVKNLVIRGLGKAVLKMNKADYQNPELYKPSEWRHLLALYSAENVIIRDLEFSSSGGDGIYLGSNSGLVPNRNIRIENVISCGNHRQGISIISGDGITIRNSTFCCTKGAAPECGLDIEPNYPEEQISNILIENCDFRDNHHCGILLHMQSFLKPSSVTIRNCRSYGNYNCGLSVYAPPTLRTAGGTINIENCRFEKNLDSAMILNNQFSRGQKITFRDCLFDNRSSRDPRLLIFNNSQLEVDAGGVRFAGKNLWYSDHRGELFSQLVKTPGQKITGVTGSVTVLNSQGESRKLYIQSP